ncbi:MAG: metallophosphoesterase [Verrucomicrobiales bacterium]|nr:metallophosphoesterase [Verrucomicrobiales bacterium]
MNRRRFVQSLTTGSAVVWVSGGEAVGEDPGAAASAAPNPSPVAKPPLVTTPLVLQAPRADGCDAVWGVGELSRGRVEWESESGNGGFAAVDNHGFVPQGTRWLRVRVDGLESGKSYRLRTVTTSADGARSEGSEWKTYRPLDPAAAASRFVVWNDTHMNDETIQRLHDVTPSADFLVWNGDTCNDWHREDLLVPTVLHPGNRDITTGRPMFVVCGNHDVRGLWAYRMPEMIAWPERRPFFAFRSGPVAVVCLHTGEDKPDSHPSFGGRVAFDELRKEQTRWLTTVLAREDIARAPYRVVFCHIPLRWQDETLPDYAKGGFDRFSYRSREAWHELLVAWKAQVIISGHTHHSAWLAPTASFLYGQLVGGGPSPKAATWIQGEATRENLRLVMRKLDGSVDQEVVLPPVA